VSNVLSGAEQFGISLSLVIGSSFIFSFHVFLVNRIGDGMANEQPLQQNKAKLIGLTGGEKEWLVLIWGYSRATIR